MNEKATIYDIASDAGVSIATVSRVLRGETNVSEATREKVQRAIGLDLRSFDDAITFKIALMVVRYMKYMETLEY